MAEHPVPQERAEHASWRLMSPADHPLIRAVGRMPAGVHAKLLVAFVGTGLLVVVVGLLGLRLLGQSNERVEALGTLQKRAVAYGKLHNDAEALREMLSANVDPAFYTVNPIGADPNRGPKGRRAVNQVIATAAAGIKASTFPDQLGFAPPPEEAGRVRKLRVTGEELSEVMQRILHRPLAHPSKPLQLHAEALAVLLKDLAANLDNVTSQRSNALIAQNAEAYTSSRDEFIGVAAGAIVLALLLGFVLSWSLIGPIQRIDFRLAAIASGNFSEHVNVDNRDELGALAANVNRMNDELDRLYKELETASQHKSDFLANMSHELRTPLNAIIGFSQVLREGMVGDVNAKQKEYLDDILSSGNHLLSLINDVLDLSKIEAGQAELQVAPFSLQDALERGVSMVREQATAEGVQVTLHRNGSLDVFSGDERRIRQVIFNLLSNAVKFTPEGGQVDVCAERVDGEMRVSVTDSGPGIAVEDRERIFEEFQQTDAAAQQREGTGLGLALSKRFVEMHGGRIWCESEVGRGSTFEFTLPMEPVER
jgi:signal transduction histidine kinase